jgi:hypothetical protein
MCHNAKRVPAETCGGMAPAGAKGRMAKERRIRGGPQDAATTNVLPAWQPHGSRINQRQRPGTG